jgi:hypothetical protein
MAMVERGDFRDEPDQEIRLQKQAEFYKKWLEQFAHLTTDKAYKRYLRSSAQTTYSAADDTITVKVKGRSGWWEIRTKITGGEPSKGMELTHNKCFFLPEDEILTLVDEKIRQKLHHLNLLQEVANDEGDPRLFEALLLFIEQWNKNNDD